MRWTVAADVDAVGDGGGGGAACDGICSGVIIRDENTFSVARSDSSML